MQITLTLDLTAENLDKLKIFCQETGAAPAKKTEAAAKAEAPKQEAPKEKPEPAPVTKAEAPKEKPEPEAKTEEPKKKLTMTDVRAVALKLSKGGKSDVLKEIFAKFGATKLSEVPAEKYDELMQELTANA